METQSNECQVDSGSMKYYRIKIITINADILRCGNYLNTELNELKLKVGDHFFLQQSKFGDYA